MCYSSYKALQQAPNNILSRVANLHGFSRKLLNPATFVTYNVCVCCCSQHLQQNGIYSLPNCAAVLLAPFPAVLQVGARSPVPTISPRSPADASSVPDDTLRSFKAHKDAITTCVQHQLVRGEWWVTFLWPLIKDVSADHQKMLQNLVDSPKSCF